VEGEPPDLPSEGFSPVAKDFVRSCLNKIPTKRHTYPMLLAHPWMKPLTQPETITEDVEAEDAADDLADVAGKLCLDNEGNLTCGDGGGDREVARWVQLALARKSSGLVSLTELAAPAVRPALHAAPLDSVSPPAGGGSPMVGA
jgi:mitogen-activated protein kinase kinase